MVLKSLPKKVIEITCQCGFKVAQYHKGGNGRLRKMWFERIKDDLGNGLITTPPLGLNTHVFCPECQKRWGTVQIIKGKYALKINQGVIRQ